MSTKLHHAFELKLPRASLTALHAWAEGLRADLQPLALTVVGQWIARNAVARFDRATLRGQAISGCLAEAFCEAMKEQQRSQKERGVAVDVEARVELFVDARNRRVHGLYFIENETLRERFLAHPQVVPTPYWNHSDDRDPTITRRQWQARGVLWDRLLGRPGIPTDHSLGLKLVDWRTSPDMDAQAMATFLPDLATRVEPLAREALIEEVVLAAQAAGEPIDGYRTFQRLLRREFYHPDEAQREAIRERLKPEVTVEDLL